MVLLSGQLSGLKGGGHVDKSATQTTGHKDNWLVLLQKSGSDTKLDIPDKLNKYDDMIYSCLRVLTIEN
jgi:hypothetical protein